MLSTPRLTESAFNARVAGLWALGTWLQSSARTLRMAQIRATLAPLGALLAVACAGGAQAQTLVNGSFESPVIGDGTYAPTPAPGWTGGSLIMNPDLAGKFFNGGDTWPQADTGAQYIDIGNRPASALSQTVVFASPGSYAFGWSDHTALGLTGLNQTSPYKMEVLNVQSQVVAFGDYNAWHGNGQWGKNSLVASLASGSYTLRFTSTDRPGTADVLIDSVSISAVPEPGSSALLLLGLGAGGLLRHRRSKLAG